MADKGFIDFHIHSTRSDGRYTPEEVTDLAVDSGVTVMALTDHNRLSLDIDELMQEAEGKLFELSQTNMKKDYTQIDPVLEQAVNIAVANNSRVKSEK